MLDTYITELIGEWIGQYPYLKATAEIVFIIIALVFLQNFLYWLTRLISGER